LSADVTVVIPTYNRADYVAQAIDSVLAQSLENWRLVVVDDASTDDTKSVLSRYEVDSRIDVLLRQHNGGAARSMNTALSAVNTPYLLHLDSDDWLDSRCLEVLLAASAQLPDTVGAIYGDFQTWSAEGGDLTPAWVTHCPLYRNEYEVLTRWGSACPRMYRVEALRALGGWAVDVLYGGRYVEDMTTIARIAARFGLCHVNQVLYNYRWHDGNESQDVFRHREYIRWLIRDCLECWGGEFVPLFSERPNSSTVPDVILLSWRRQGPAAREAHAGRVELGEFGLVSYEYTSAGRT